MTLSRIRPAPTPPPVTDGDSDYTARPHSRRRAAFPRVAIYALLALLMVIGLFDIVGKFTHHTPTPPPPPPALDADTARAAAARYATDYLSYDPAVPTQRAAALAADAGTSPDALTGFTGPAQLRAGQVLPGQVTADGPDTATVTVTAAITPATLAAGQPTPTTSAAPTVPDLAAAPGPVTAPWQADTTRWLTLHVAVHRVNGQLHATTAALAGADTPRVLPVPTGASTDPALTTATAGLPADLFPAYASGQTTYLTVPGTTLPGLRGAVKVDHLTDWTVYTATDSSGDRTATATVTWAFPDGLTIAQHYVLRLQSRDGRWLVDGLDVRVEN